MPPLLRTTGLARVVTLSRDWMLIDDPYFEVMRRVFDDMSDAVVACGASGELSYFNRTARRWHGSEEDSSLPEHWPTRYDLYAPDGKRLQPSRVPLARALRGEAVKDQEIVIAPKDRPRVRAVCTGTQIVDGGKIKGAIVVMRKVT